MKIFVGSTFEDLIDHRQRVISTLKQLFFGVEAMEIWGASPEDSLTTCLGKVESSDIYLCILGFRYGSITPMGISYVEAEYDRVIETGKICLPFLMDSNSHIPVKFVDTGIKAQKLSDFKDKIKERHTCSWFTDPKELAQKVATSVYDTMTTHRLPGFEHINLQAFWKDVHQGWLNVGPDDLRFDLDVKRNIQELSQEINAELEAMEFAMARLWHSSDKLPDDLEAIVKSIGGDLEKLHSIPYYENPFIARDWELLTFFPNRINRLHLLISQMEIKAYEIKALQGNWTEDDDYSLQCAKERLEKATRKIRID